MSKQPTESRPQFTVISRPARKHRIAEKTTFSHQAPRLSATVSKSKSDQVLAMLKRTGGANIADLVKATQWQSHSVRGFLLGALRKCLGHTVVSELKERGLRRYQITGEAGAYADEKSS